MSSPRGQNASMAIIRPAVPGDAVTLAELARGAYAHYTNEAMAENLAYYPRHGFAETHRATDHGYRRVFFTKRL